MNEEEKAITTNAAAAEKSTKSAKPKRTDEEKLQECYEKRDRLREQKTAHKNKGQAIDKSIADNNAKIAELENKELFKICKEKKIATQELIDFLRKLPNGTSLENVGNSVFQNVPKNSDEQKL